MQRTVGLAVAAGVEAVADGLVGGGGDRAGAAERREGGLAFEPLDVLAGGDEELAGVAGRDAEKLDGARCGCGDELLDPSPRSDPATPAPLPLPPTLFVAAAEAAKPARPKPISSGPAATSCD